MKVHTTNYKNTFIAIADDCPVDHGEIPPAKGGAKTIAGIQFEILNKHPYKFTSDDVLFQVYAQRNDLTKTELPVARAHFFSKGQPCLRASPLTKRYGWGIHNDANGKIALIGSDTSGYKKMISDKSLTVVKAMKSSK
jgi:Family of unknown function (DUF6157)